MSTPAGKVNRLPVDNSPAGFCGLCHLAWIFCSCAPTGEKLEKRLRELEPIDVVVALTWRLALAIDKLRALARECAECGGKGETAERFEIRLMTNDPRLLDPPHAYLRREKARRYGPKVEGRIRGAANLWSKCPACADIRATILICEATGPAKARSK